MEFNTIEELTEVARRISREATNDICLRFNNRGKRVCSDIHKIELMILRNIWELHLIIDMSKLPKITDGYTFVHSIKTSVYAALFAFNLYLPDDKINEIIKGCLLHDFGKIFLPREVIYKTDPLTEEDINAIKTHVTLGYDFFKTNKSLSIVVKKIILLHHNNIDGNGYPDEIGKEAMSFEVELASISDVYDALASDRPYRKALRTPEALKLMRSDIGIKFSEEMLELFIKTMGFE